MRRSKKKGMGVVERAGAQGKRRDRAEEWRRKFNFFSGPVTSNRIEGELGVGGFVVGWGRVGGLRLCISFSP